MVGSVSSWNNNNNGCQDMEHVMRISFVLQKKKKKKHKMKHCGIQYMV